MCGRHRTTSRPATLPLVGPVTNKQDGVYGATGYHKWGMTNSVGAAIRLRGLLIGAEPDWAQQLDDASAAGGTAVEMAKMTAGAGWSATTGWLGLAVGGRTENEGEGSVRLEGGKPVAECVVDGVQHRVSAVCPHLGGIVRWNDAERSWDCPLHGSRFTATGEVLEGPSVTGLEPVEASG